MSRPLPFSLLFLNLISYAGVCRQKVCVSVMRWLLVPTKAANTSSFSFSHSSSHLLANFINDIWSMYIEAPLIVFVYEKCYKVKWTLSLRLHISWLWFDIFASPHTYFSLHTFHTAPTNWRSLSMFILCKQLCFLVYKWNVLTGLVSPLLVANAEPVCEKWGLVRDERSW